MALKDYAQFDITINQAMRDMAIATLASQVIPAEHLEAFLALPIKAQLTGIAFFANLVGDTRIRDVAVNLYNSLD